MDYYASDRRTPRSRELEEEHDLLIKKLYRENAELRREMRELVENIRQLSYRVEQLEEAKRGLAIHYDETDRGLRRERYPASSIYPSRSSRIVSAGGELDTDMDYVSRLNASTSGHQRSLSRGSKDLI